MAEVGKAGGYDGPWEVSARWPANTKVGPYIFSGKTTEGEWETEAQARRHAQKIESQGAKDIRVYPSHKSMGKASDMVWQYSWEGRTGGRYYDAVETEAEARRKADKLTQQGLKNVKIRQVRNHFNGIEVKVLDTKEGESINTGNSVGKSMPKSIRKEPEPVPEEEEKEDTEIKPFDEEEKSEDRPKGPAHDEMKTAPAAKAVPEDEDEDEEFEDALKAIGARFDNLEKAITSLAEVLKANYTSKPSSVQGDYPTPPEAGPKSDGLQGPKIDQENNPASKPFGKGKPTSPAAKNVPLGGATDGSRERPMDSEASLRDLRAQILKGETTIVKENQRRMALRGGF